MAPSHSRSRSPTALLVHGARDPRPPYAIDDLTAALPHAEVRVIEDTGHIPWLERPGALSAVIRPWLAARD